MLVEELPAAEQQPIPQQESALSDLEREFLQEHGVLDVGGTDEQEEIPLTLDALFADGDAETRAEGEPGQDTDEEPETGEHGIDVGDEQDTDEEEDEEGSEMGDDSRKKGRRKKKKQSLAAKIVKWVVSAIVILIIAVAVVGVVYVYGIVKDMPRYTTADLEASLMVMSTMYDDQGQPLKNIYLAEGRRTLATYQEMPEDFVNALVAIEDKTFWTHKGFNIIRIAGAIVESAQGGGSISGTSTITQQLARNIWMFDERTERSAERKIKEAFYARELEQNLSKEEILSAYLNTIALGNHSYGIAAAAENYYGKNLKDLDLIECAALAALPKAPSEYAMIITVTPGEVAPDDPRILLSGVQYTYLYNENIEPRLKLVLSEMFEQGYITEKEYNAALNDNIRRHLHPKELEVDSNADFFVSYAIDQIAEDLLRYDPAIESYDEAMQKIYGGGLDIYTTFNHRAQDIAMEEFGDPENFPYAQLTDVDRLGNLIDDYKSIVLFAEDYMFVTREDESQWIHLVSDGDAEPYAWCGDPNVEENRDYMWRDDGSMVIFSGPTKRFGIYNTEGAGGRDINLEIKDFYTKPEGVLYMTKGGYINIPTEYKGMDDKNNLILSKKYFDSPECIFTIDEENEVWINVRNISLRQEVLQPQAAFVLVDHTNGQLKAMVGGRDIKGQFQYNRTISPRQPGSTIKPIGVYGPAIEMSANGERTGVDMPTFGPYWSPLSIILDEEMEYQGRRWPKNWYNSFRGPLTMRNSIEQSVNINAVKVQLAIGDERSIT
ncbi:MAG: transglycosylase domain-containing protein, partial [Clostridiales bacterium]|nr:transglycosylase domain-containing protein [Clostridiales bacterium]